MQLFPYPTVLPFWLLTCSWTGQEVKEHVSTQESPWNFVFYFKYFSWPKVQSALLLFIAADICIVIAFLWWDFLSQSQSLLYQWGLEFNHVFWKKAFPLCFWSYYLIIALDLHLYCIWKQAALVSLTLMGSKQKITMLIQLLQATDCCRSWMLKNILQFLKCLLPSCKWQHSKALAITFQPKSAPKSSSCHCPKWNLVQESHLVIYILAEKVTMRN